MFLRFPHMSRMTKWIVACFVLVLACTIHFSSSSASDYYREFIYHGNADHTLSIPSGLVNAKQMTTKVKNKMTCVFACTRSRPWCGSVNFKIQAENDGHHICELLSTDMYTKPSYLQPTQGFTHLSIKNKCENPSPCQDNGECSPDYGNDDYHCTCNTTKGRNCQTFYSDCTELLSAGHTTDGVYQIDPDGQGSFPVYCDMTTDGGGWTVFQRVNTQLISFSRGWQDYKNGFGSLHTEFWLGLDKIYRLTKRQVTKLRVDLEAPTGNKGYALYSSFSIADEGDFYRLHVSGYSGTAGNSLTTGRYSNWISNNHRFTTSDRDNDNWSDGNCGGDIGWWYNHCSASTLNKKVWHAFGQISKTEMKLK